jgi:hypothetical protein
MTVIHKNKFEKQNVFIERISFVLFKYCTSCSTHRCNLKRAMIGHAQYNEPKY